MFHLPLMIASVASMALPAFAQPPDLQTFVRKDLQSLPAGELTPLLKLLGHKREVALVNLFGPSPWHVWVTTKSMPKRFLVFEGQNLFSIPGASSAKVHLFDTSGKKLTDWAFSTGWRIDLNRASISYSDDLAAYLITLDTFPDINGRAVAKQYFAFSDDRLRFVRMEDPKGQLLVNNYEHPNHTLGIVPEAQSTKDWAELLQSTNKADILSALTFLGGRHPDPPRKVPELLVQEIEQARMVKEIRRDERIGKLVRRHSNSEFKWIAEAAKVTARTLTQQ